MAKKKFTIEIDEKTYEHLKDTFEHYKLSKKLMGGDSIHSINTFEEFLSDIIDKLFSSPINPYRVSKENIKEMFESILSGGVGGFEDLFNSLFPSDKKEDEKEEEKKENITKLKN